MQRGKNQFVSVSQWVSERVSQSVSEFWDPLHISVTVEARNFKFGTQIGHGGGPKRNSAKLGQKGSWRGQVTYFWNFGTLFISPKLLKLETSNLAQELATGGPNGNMQN